MKRLHQIHTSHGAHWVGDGFPVRTLFSYNDDAARLSPFLLLDYAGPAPFQPTTERRGVGEHPHRGFETVTIVYSGEVEHRDSSGGGGIIGPGEVQWMTAASGIVHSEFHSDAFARQGGVFEVVQLWVNLPAGHKMAAPGYQNITRDRIPEIDLPDGAGRIRLIAGDWQAVRAPARSFTPMTLWDLRLKAGARIDLPLQDGHNAMILGLRGRVGLPGGGTLGQAELASFGREGSGVTLTAATDATVLVMGGEPIDEPVVGQGPFVMNSAEEIHQAKVDYRLGRMGRLARQA